MAIQWIKIQNLLAFQNDAFSLSFCDGVNVLIGENGTGKTTLLKLLYAAMECASMEVGSGINVKFYSFFSDHLKGTGFLKHPAHRDRPCNYQISDGKETIRFDFLEALKRHQSFRPDRRFNSVLIPATEMLSHSKGFLAFSRKFRMPFDATQVDIIMNASLPETWEVSPPMQSILDKISQVIDGTVIQEDDIFYILKNDGRKLDFSLEAEGLRKLGLLWKLIRNGLLEKDSILLWDEPEGFRWLRKLCWNCPATAYRFLLRRTVITLRNIWKSAAKRKKKYSFIPYIENLPAELEALPGTKWKIPAETR